MKEHHAKPVLTLHDGGAHTLTARDRAELRRKGLSARVRNALLRLYDETRLIPRTERAERMARHLAEIAAMLEEDAA
jgi:hypothetical protein